MHRLRPVLSLLSFVSLSCRWPFWLSPRQISIVPVAEQYNAYAEIVRKSLHDAGYFVDLDTSNKQFAKKIRESAIAQYNYTIVVGEKEQASNTINVRPRSDPEHPYERSLEAWHAELKEAMSKFQ